jgi:hypothetical protein
MMDWNSAMITVALTVLPWAAGAQTPAGSDGSDRASYRHYIAVRNVNGALLDSGLQKFGKRLRTAATLEVCNKPGIAKAIEPTPDERHSYFMDEVTRMRGGTDEYGQTLLGMSGAEIVGLVHGATDQTITYAMGYKDAMRPISSDMPDVCNAAVLAADKMLKERSAK